jgi:hypothetical protein
MRSTVHTKPQHYADAAAAAAVFCHTVLVCAAAEAGAAAVHAVHAVHAAQTHITLLLLLLLLYVQLLKLAQLQLQYMQYRLEEKVEADQALEDDSLAIAAGLSSLAAPSLGDIHNGLGALQADLTQLGSSRVDGLIQQVNAVFIHKSYIWAQSPSALLLQSLLLLVCGLLWRYKWHLV